MIYYIAEMYGKKKSEMCIYRRMVKQIWYIHAEYFSAIKRNRILIYCMTWMKLESIVLSKRSQSQKTTYEVIPFI